MALPQLVSRNGRLIAPADAHISIFNPVIFGAFGVYESIQLCQGVCFRLDDHLQRLADSAAAIDLELPAGLETIGRWTHAVIAANGCRDALIRMFALGPTAGNAPELFIWPEAPRAFPPELFQQGVGAVTFQGERALPHAKSLNTLVNHLARTRAQKAGEHEGLLVDRHGCVTEGSTSNLFVVQAGVLLTAPAEDVLAGVTQLELLGLARDLAVPVEERPLPLADLARWQEAFLSSTSRHVLPLVRIDGQPVGDGRPGPITRRLQAAFERHFLAEIQRGQPGSTLP
ncbi:MAG TPA: aminotransferase class IV [Anaerolineae bacterium]|nr:aminotransferase class IV [Anaerolineae bacterium]HNU03461.1 aminotransferase class IV [Anaerolineae bacterium]